MYHSVVYSVAFSGSIVCSLQEIRDGLQNQGNAPLCFVVQPFRLLIKNTSYLPQTYGPKSFSPKLRNSSITPSYSFFAASITHGSAQTLLLSTEKNPKPKERLKLEIKMQRFMNLF